MTLRWLIVAQSPSAYMLSVPSTRSHSSVASTRLLPWLRHKILTTPLGINSATNHEIQQKHKTYMPQDLYLTNLLHKVHDNRTSSNSSWPNNHAIWHCGNSLTILNLFGGNFFIWYFHNHWPSFDIYPSLLNLSSAKAVIHLSNLHQAFVWDKNEAL